jgi:hypothetical protein
MKRLISDGPYDEINYNPLNKMITTCRTALTKIKTKYNTTFDALFKIRNPKVLRLYGLTKTHKPGNKMRSIVSNNDAKFEKISKWLCDEFSKLPDPTGFFVKNTQAFLEKLKDVSIENKINVWCHSMSQPFS